MKFHIRIAKWFFSKQEKFHIIGNVGFSIYCVLVFSRQPSYMYMYVVFQ